MFRIVTCVFVCFLRKLKTEILPAEKDDTHAANSQMGFI